MADASPPRPDGPESPPPSSAPAATPRPARPPRLARPQPKPQGGGQPAESESIGSGSATGFVSMLARKQFDADLLSATPADEAARRDRLQMAHEVETGIPVEPATGVPVPVPAAAAAIPGWIRVMFPLSLVMAAVLLTIGAWAIGALAYMHNVSPIKPQDVHYPLISWRLDLGNMGGYTPASRFMAEAMLLCIPVAALLVLMAWMLRQRARER